MSGRENPEESGEDQLIRRLVSLVSTDENVLAGAGDDCAVVRSGDASDWLLKTDCVVAGIHFDEMEAPERVGGKAMGRVLSDMAAMAGVPLHALVTLGVPSEIDEEWLVRLYRGMVKQADGYGVNIVGGETSRTRGPLFLSVSMLGAVDCGKAVLRSTGSAGDLLYVTGQLGGSLAGHHLDFVPRIREARWLTEHFRPTAMMDLSDGLAADLPRLARSSGVGYRVDTENIPQRNHCGVEAACSDGEDYELLFSIPAENGHALEHSWRTQFPELPLTCIGSLQNEGMELLGSGYDHMRTR